MYVNNFMRIEDPEKLFKILGQKETSSSSIISFTFLEHSRYWFLNILRGLWSDQAKVSLFCSGCVEHWKTTHPTEKNTFIKVGLVVTKIVGNFLSLEGECVGVTPFQTYEQTDRHCDLSWDQGGKEHGNSF